MHIVWSLGFGVSLFFVTARAQAGDWLHWRGSEQTGVSRDTGLPGKWSREGENLLWKQPFGGRSTPLVSRGRVTIINGTGSGVTEQERVMCFDAKTGKLLWEHKFNIFHTDIVTNRVGWANLAGDPETGNVYAHGVQGLFFCFDPDGKILWSKSLTEEFGRISGYGGRIGSPIVDGDLVIMNMLNASWGDQGRGGHRFVAMNKKTGEIVWWSEPGGLPTDTVYSNAVVADINGQRLLICGHADGGICAMKVNTGERVWNYVFSKRGINVSPVVDGNLVYVAQGEENLDTTTMGCVVCLDAATVADGQPKVVWRRTGLLVGYSSPLIHEGRLYACDNSARMFCLDAKDGRTLWDHKYGTVAKGSPVWADGKIYIGEVTSKFHIIEPKSDGAKTISTVEFPAGKQGEVYELNGSVAVAEGRVFIGTQEGLYCIGLPDGKAGVSQAVVKDPPKQDPVGDAKLAHLQIVPADVTVPPGAKVTFKARGFDVNGNFVKEVTDGVWTLPSFQPPPPLPGAPLPKPAPPIKGEVKDGVLALAADMPAQSGQVFVEVGGVIGKARVRVAPLLPISQDFEKVNEGAIPTGWINTAGKFIVEVKDGNKVLKKRGDNPNPLVARANAFIGLPNMRDYTIEADLMGTQRKRNMPDMGIVNSRYSLVLDGNKERLWIRSWEANHRFEKKLDYKWKPNVWYHFKLLVTHEGGKAVCKGKVWPKDEKEPDGWSLEIDDPIGNPEGSPALYAYATGITANSPGAEVYFDNVRVVPNQAGR